MSTTTLMMPWHRALDRPHSPDHAPGVHRRRRHLGARIPGTADPCVGLGARDIRDARRSSWLVLGASFRAAWYCDIGLPDLNGLDLQKRIADDRPDTPVIFITGHGDVPTIVRAMKAGAVEFLVKPFSGDVLVRAIDQALERSRRALEHEAKMRALREGYAALTPREREVMVLVVSGLLNKQVGGELGISEITVKAHRGQVMRKMKADSLPALVRMAGRLS